MDRTTELDLLDELLSLKAEKSFFLDDAPTVSPIERYISQDQFEHEQAALFRELPHMVAHSSELPEPGSFLKRDMAGLPVLLTRDENREVRAFLNVRRHRGTQLVSDETGCQRRFSCPYHAWTWNNRGELLAIPHQDKGFPGFDKSDFGLKRLACTERYGWIWVQPNANGALDVDEYLGGLAKDFHWLKADDLEVFAVDDHVWNVNWKVLIEGGIESYHFKIAHKNTIGPYFQDNLSSYQLIGKHLRSVLPRTALDELQTQSRDLWSIRTHTNIIYSVFPSSQLLVQEDHIVWIQTIPLSPDRTRLRLHTLSPKATGTDADMPAAHWKRNHEITRSTLMEDFEIGESIQRGLRSGANTHLTFGRYEGALDTFNRIIDEHIAQERKN